MMILGRNAVQLSHEIIKQTVKVGDIVVDATCGNGNDTLLLAKLVGNEGKVFAFDIQNAAIENTNLLLQKNNIANRVELINDSHCSITKYLLGDIDIKVCMFNLGYLPGSDKNIITKPDTTIKAINNILPLMKKTSVIPVVAYLGHEGGYAEYIELKNYFTNLEQTNYRVVETAFINQKNNPPRLIIVEKL
ncbi:Putative rRNA methylase YtqB [Candidatus Syntrophocurvum alkaliphilum]|uniref:rRNA methylase YtqB n=1 Tax=Candidatus Syntrophocurvum alkaliphilum TaxID=2293317 RepID=A0A6I6DDV5_9FIRM|nr:class I SAM-dependent methyltransferase [Candidatus Syntrophocurvum alkaliphilum]QGT98972.1 Putative rRNA methylase YtqB [Candidatus Syntrophocurvum alkaliphilum]